MLSKFGKNRSIYKFLFVSLILIIIINLANIQIFNSISNNIPLLKIQNNVDWNRSNQNNQSQKYSALNQINIANIKDLEPVWIYNSGETGKILSVQTNPISNQDNSILFITSPCCIIAINSKTGNEIWRRSLSPPVGRRGITFDNGLLFVPTGDGIFILNSNDGSNYYSFNIMGSFSHDVGSIGREISLLPPIVNRNKVIFANYNGTIEAWDYLAKKRLWKSELSKNGLTARIWSGISYDEILDTVYVVTSNNSGLFRGADVDDFASSLVALNGNTGDIEWQFQEIRLERWDLDLVGPPLLFNYSQDDRYLPAIVSLSKTGNIIFLNRITGKPIFGIDKISVPETEFNNDYSARYQNLFTLPEPISYLKFDFQNDITMLSEDRSDYVRHLLRNAKSGLYQPNSLRHDVIMFGLNGGAEWPGGSLDPNRQILYVPSNKIAFILRTYFKNLIGAQTKDIVKKYPYFLENCSSCHGEDLNGEIETEGGSKYVSSLVGLSLTRPKDQLYGLKQFNFIHKYSAPNSSTLAGKNVQNFDDRKIENLANLFEEIDRFLNEKNGMRLDSTYQTLIDQYGQYGSNPPWGYINAIDLRSGHIIWRVPSGIFYDKNLKKNISGDINFGGILVTSGNILFSTGGREKNAYGYNVENGSEIWKAALPASGSAPPMTYMIDGCQYILFVSTGGERFKNYSDSYIAYKLKSCESNNIH